MQENRAGTTTGRGPALAAAVMGIGGTAMAAYASHASADPRLAGAVALVCLANAPVMLALALAERTNALLRTGGWVLALGVFLFCADLTMRIFQGAGLFTYAAPTGGFSIMAGWALIAVAFWMQRKRGRA